MKIIHIISTIFLTITSTFLHANVYSNMSEITVEERKSYEDFKDYFHQMIGRMFYESVYSSQNKDIKISQKVCDNPYKLVELLSNNQKFQTQYDLEFAQDGKTFNEALDDFKNTINEMKLYCDKVKMEYESTKQ